MERRRLLDLPNEYTPLNYIESTGTQYIELSSNISSYSSYRLEVDILGRYSSDNRNGIFGAYPNNQVISAFYQYNTSTQKITYSSTVGGDPANGGISCFRNCRSHYVLTNSIKEWTLYDSNGEVAETSSQVLTRPLNGSITKIKLFGSYLHAQSYPIGLYSLNITINNTLLFDLHPAKRNSDGVIGLYDNCGTICQLTGTPFYINAGTGIFLFG